jgi:predicted protein tyrosine phosphatase
MMQSKQHVLFICSRNQWRSPTAEQLYRSHPSLSVRSAGTSASARRTVSAADIDWAHTIIVMEDKHQSRLKAQFGSALQGKPLHVLDIPDEYRYMDAQLIELLNGAIDTVLELG